MVQSLKTEIKQLNHPTLPVRSEKEIENLVTSLLKKMTLDEKVGQLYEAGYDGTAVTGPSFSSNRTRQLIAQGRVGSLIGMSDIEQMYALQKAAVTESRLKIPLLFCNDIIHGYRTIFPVNIALSGTFNPALVEEAMKVAAFESSHSGVSMTFSPMLDLARDPRWGRVVEGNGEDPYLSSLMAKAYVNGYQQGNLSSADAICACAKHFIGYGAVEGGRDYNTVDMSQHRLHQYYLPPFQAAIEANVQGVMSSFNVFDSEPLTSNQALLKGLLKNELGFKGFVISDYTASEEIMEHKVASNPIEVAQKCLEAGLDHEMISTTFIDQLPDLVKQGKVAETLIDDATRRVLSVKYRMGLFDNPFKNIYDDHTSYWRSPEAIQLTRKAAQESIILLENKNQTLPLKKTSPLTIAIIGPYADNPNFIGPWGGLGETADCITLYKGIQEAHPTAKIVTAKGADVFSKDEKLIPEALQVAAVADIVILALGEDHSHSSEAGCRAYLNFPGAQPALIEAILKLNKKTILVVTAGRPLELTPYKDRFDAILYGWFLGNEAGHALADIIFGEVVPSGRVTLSFPITVGQIPVYYNHLHTGRPKEKFPEGYRYDSHYLDIPNEPLYPFGYGLNFSPVIYQHLTLSSPFLKNKGDAIEVKVEVTNQGDYPVYEVAQLYIEAKSNSMSRPVNELKGFQKVYLKPHQTKTISFRLKSSEFGFLNRQLVHVVEKGQYLVKVGTSSASHIDTTLEIIE